VQDIEWRDGESLNISGSGLLFRAEQPLESQTPVELSVELPGIGADGVAVRIACRGHVVRTVETDSATERPLVAATIDAYRFIRAGQADRE
jgi:hypothetical protein